MATVTPGPPFVRSAYNYDRNAASDQTGLACPQGESKTQQHFKDEADINTIVRRFGITGQLPQNLNLPQSGDFTGISDFHTAANIIRQAQEEFLRVPAETRARFSNDPAQLLDFVHDSNNRDEAIRLGLIPKPAEATRTGEPVPPTPKPAT